VSNFTSFGQEMCKVQVQIQLRS